MKNQDQAILHEIQKNTHMGLEAIDAMMPRVKDEVFAKELAGQSVKYGEYYEKASDRLSLESDRLYKDVKGKDLVLRSSIWMQTFMDGSSGHMADMMIQGVNRGITDLQKVLNHNRHASNEIIRLASDVMDMEQQAIGRLREYL